ncbi:helix-turn-helix transcriptional regulator [Rariglobus hedericola]|uniref:helix-turn-helix transcriptional regulator n=1 Tax=Rariglobus hedericola TaxID=2597822 RepID=UPI001EF005D5|nr:AraC family transcriptional regulator [Rariglobus hedericola]
MDKIGTHSADALLSKQVSETRYFFLNLGAKKAGKDIAVTLGGRERCNLDYEIHRSFYSYYGLEYVAEGAGEATLDGVRYELRPGSLFSYAPSTRCEMATDPQKPMLKYFICFTGANAGPRLKRAGVAAGVGITLAGHAEIRSVLEDLVKEGQRSGSLADKICAHLLEVLLLKIEDSATSAAQGDPALENFHRCKSLIDAQADKLLTLQEIATAAGLEESSICRLFRRYHDTSPYQYLLRRKMNLAAAFLVKGGGMVKEAAQRVGFTDPYHFSRRFKAVHGVAPKMLLKHASKTK